MGTLRPWENEHWLSYESSDVGKKEGGERVPGLVRRLQLKRTSSALNKGPKHSIFYLMQSPHSQIYRCCYYSQFSDEKPKALRVCEICLQLIYSTEEPGFEPKSEGFQSPCSFHNVMLIYATFCP